MRTDFTFAALLEFDDKAGLEAYLAHPAHDRLAAQFFASFEEALIYDFEMLEGELADHACAGRVRELRVTAERTINEIRRIIAALSPAALERFGLLPAIRHLANRLRQRPELRVQLSLPRRPPRLAPASQIALYRILQ